MMDKHPQTCRLWEQLLAKAAARGGHALQKLVAGSPPVECFKERMQRIGIKQTAWC